MKTKTTVQLVVAGCAIVLIGCNRSQQNEEIVLWGQRYYLRPVAGAKPVDLTHVEFDGHCTETEKLEISKCLGRIPVQDLHLKQISVVWSEARVAARVYADNGHSPQYLIFLVKAKDGQWRIVEEAAVVY